MSVKIDRSSDGGQGELVRDWTRGRRLCFCRECLPCGSKFSMMEFKMKVSSYFILFLFLFFLGSNKKRWKDSTNNYFGSLP